MGREHPGPSRAIGETTYGWRRTSILAALINAVVLLVTMGGDRLGGGPALRHPATVAGETVILVAAVGIVINGATALLSWPAARAT